MKITDIKSITDIRIFSQFQNKESENRKNALKEFMDATLVDTLDDDIISYIYNHLCKSIEYKIRQVIEELTGEMALPIGTKIILNGEWDGYKEGEVLTITECTRVEEDIFNQGWYTYTAERTKKFLLYKDEFTIVE